MKGIADIVWAIISASGGIPGDNAILCILYLLTNCFFAFSLVYFAVHQFRKWDLVQFGLDIFISAYLGIILLWILFAHKDIDVLRTIIASDITSIFSIITDIIIGVTIMAWFLSIRGGKMPGFLNIFAVGLFLFAFADMLYYYVDFYEIYDSNGLIDILYILSFVIIAFGALWKTYKNSSIVDLFVVTNIGNKGKWLCLLAAPLVMIVFTVTGIIPIRLDVGDFFAVGGPMLFYLAASKYVQISLEKEMLLKQNNFILEQRVAEQVGELTFLANQDTLTTLFNRRYLMICLNETIESARSNELIALLLVDIDRFKTINDTFGHDVGDKVLIDLSYRMIAWNNYGATIARLGGDEFAFMLTGKYSQKDVVEICTEIIDLCRKPFDIGSNELSVTMSVGVAYCFDNSCTGKSLLKHADIAMYRAKSQGYNKYQIYDAFMSRDFKKSVEIEVLLRQTDADKDFELFYQPQYALPGKELIGAEALLRWKNNEHGYIPPSDFIPVAEQIDYIHKIGKWVMQETVSQSITWNRMYNFPLRIGFNISPKQFNDESFTGFIKSIITDSGVNPAWIDAEITESIIMSEDDRATLDNAFSAFHELGISVSIDDFGAGYSTLSYLNKYPFDRIKIDKSLVDSINSRNISGANIVRAAINMAHAAGIQTIAEGVETQEQLDILIELGCDQVQGYLLGRPVPADVFEQRFVKPHIKNIANY